jgi:hypothetical protein
MAALVSFTATGCGIADGTLHSLLGQSVRRRFILILSIHAIPRPATSTIPASAARQADEWQLQVSRY